MWWGVFLLAFLYAAPAFGDCLNLPIVGNGVDVPGVAEQTLPDTQGAFRPKIPPALVKRYGDAAYSYLTVRFPKVVKGVPLASSVVTCFRDSIQIPPALGPMTREQAAEFSRDKSIGVKPDLFKLPEPRTTSMLDRAWRTASRWFGAAVAWAGSGTDNFNIGGSSSDLGANWEPYINNGVSSPCEIDNDRAASGTTPGDCVEGFSGYIPTADQYVQFSLPDGFPIDDFVFVSAVVRLQPPTDYSGYICRAQPPSQTNTSRIRRIDSGSNSTLANDTVGTWSAGDVLRCEITGTSINLKKNGVTIVSASTSNEYTSGRGGINMLDTPSSPANPIDDFEVGDVGGGGAVRIPRKPLVLQ